MTETPPPSPPEPLPKGRLKEDLQDACNKSPVQNYVTSFVELLKEMKNSGESLPNTFSVTKYFKGKKQAGAAHGLVLELSSELGENDKISVIEFGSSAIKINPVYQKTKDGMTIVNNEVVDICKIKGNIDLETGNIDSKKLKEEFKNKIATDTKVQKRLDGSDINSPDTNSPDTNSPKTKFVIFLSAGHIIKHTGKTDDNENVVKRFVKECFENLDDATKGKLLKPDIYTQEGLYEATSALHYMEFDEMLREDTTRLIVTSIGGQTAQTTAITKTDGKWKIDGKTLTINMEKKNDEAAINDNEKDQLKAIFSSGERDNTQVMFMSTWGFVIRNAYNQYPDKTNKTVKEEVYVTGGPCEEGQKPEWKYKTLDNWDIFFNLLPIKKEEGEDTHTRGASNELRIKLKQQLNRMVRRGGKKTRHKNRKNKKRKTKRIRIRMKMKNRKTKIRKKTSKKYKRQTKKRA
jgi:hypothetical protein